MALLVHDRPGRLTPTGQRLLIGALLALGVAAGWSLWRQVVLPDPKVAQALWGGLFAAGATALGTLPVVLQQRISERTRDAMLGFGAGVMLAASAFSLVVPGIEAAQSLGAGPWGAAAVVAAGILLGALLLVALDHWLPHEHFIKGIEGSREHARALKRTWLFVFAISLHNLPEGLAIGVAFGGADPLAASALATGIAIQDVPEGLVIALALRGAG
jgi:ZIP family zinc transporter